MFRFSDAPMTGIVEENIPITKMWRAVLDTMLSDYVGGNTRLRAEAESWLRGEAPPFCWIRDPKNPHNTIKYEDIYDNKTNAFEYVCDMASMNPEFVKEKFKDERRLAT